MPQYGGMEWKWYVYLIHIILKSSSSVSEEKKCRIIMNLYQKCFRVQQQFMSNRDSEKVQSKGKSTLTIHIK